MPPERSVPAGETSSRREQEAKDIGVILENQDTLLGTPARRGVHSTKIFRLCFVSPATDRGPGSIAPRDGLVRRELDVGIPAVASAASGSAKLQQRRPLDFKGRQLRRAFVVERLPVQRDRDKCPV